MPEVAYDEPTTGLDPPNAARIAELVRDINRKLRVTSIVVTPSRSAASARRSSSSMWLSGTEWKTAVNVWVRSLARGAYRRTPGEGVARS